MRHKERQPRCGKGQEERIGPYLIGHVSDFVLVESGFPLDLQGRVLVGVGFFAVGPVVEGFSERAFKDLGGGGAAWI